MMRALSIFMVSVSGICLGYSLAYPVQDTSLSGYNYLGYDEVDKTAAPAVADVPNHKLSRLGRLFGSYTNLLFAGLKSSRLNEVTDKDRQLESVVFGKPVWPGNNDENSHPSIMNNGLIQLDSQRAKRQQGWYVQYGKRSQGNFLHRDASWLPALKHTGLRGLDNIAYINKGSPILFTAVLGRKKDTPMIDYGTLLPENAVELNAIDELDSDSAANIEADDSRDVNLKLGKRDLRLQVTKSKRQQGWYTTYGKRRDADDFPSVL